MCVMSCHVMSCDAAAMCVMSCHVERKWWRHAAAETAEAAEEEEEVERRRVSNEKQEPHTEMWGKKSGRAVLGEQLWPAEPEGRALLGQQLAQPTTEPRPPWPEARRHGSQQQRTKQVIR